MGTKAHDYDVATTASPEEIEACFHKTVPIGKQFGVILVLIGGAPYEVACFRKEGDYQDGRRPEWVKPATPEEDAKRRDFTINGLFYDPLKDEIIDYVGGKADIERKLIRTIGNPEDRFSEDRLRLLRAIRFGANLGFEIDQATWNSVKKNAQNIHEVSSERIRDELVKMFTRPHPDQALELLAQSLLLKEIMPEVVSMQSCEQDPEHHPEGDVFVHTKLLMKKLKDPTVTLAFSALLHDVGKPPTYNDEDGRIHFYKHEHKGAAMAREIMARLKFSNKEIDWVEEEVAMHMKFANVKDMREGKLKRFMSRDTFREEMELHRIDCLSSHGKLDNYDFLKQKIEEYRQEELKPVPLLNGKDLIDAGYKPSPKFSLILQEAYLLQLEAQFVNKEAAIAWAKQRWDEL